MTVVMADYEQPRRALDRLFEINCDRRIVLLTGEGGTGKSTLLAYCQSRRRDTAITIPIQLRSSCVGVGEILDRIGERIGWALLPRLMGRIASMDGAPDLHIDGSRLFGINNKITVILSAETTSVRQDRLGILTSELIADLSNAHTRIVLLFDTFEQAPSEVQDWLSGPFLARAVDSSHIRVVVAGRKVPDATNIEWGHVSVLHTLSGVREPDHWLPVISALGYRIPAPEPRGFLDGMCFILQGHPHRIMQYIVSFPREEAGL
jgi:hypothetical protein